ncbi:MAG: hemolytic protein HlpA [Opitutales bacterium]|tara:strand:- start:736 stop:1686 length:951 start_codon:yes stop_codon:yes gene_type:complete
MDVAPIAYLVFNRPDLVRQTFARIREARPKQLFIISDSAKPEDKHNAAQVEAVRQTIEEAIDWPCDLIKDYAPQHMGCGKRISSGLNAVFEQAEEAIILEDDCLANTSFFQYATDLLEFYRYNEHVMHIGGSRWPCKAHHFKEYSYTFSTYALVWGWATWKRAWKHFDWDMQDWTTWQNKRELYKRIHYRSEKKRRQGDWERLYTKEDNVWAAAWIYAVMKQQGLCILPAQNMIKNIGLGPQGTHTKIEHHPLNLSDSKMHFPLKHPRRLYWNARCDRIFEKLNRMHYGAFDPMRLQHWEALARRLVRKYIKRIED